MSKAHPERDRYGNTGVKVDVLIEQAASGVCNAKTRSREGRCTRQAGWGTSHLGRGFCKHHMGRTKVHEKHAVRIGAVQALTALGKPIMKDPIAALLDCVAEAAGNVAFLRQEAAALGVEIIGNKYGAAAGVGVYPQSEEARGIVQLYGEWFDRLTKTAKMAVDAGVAKAQVEIAQQQADTLASIVRGVLDGLDLTPEQRQRGRALAAAQMKTIAIGHSPAPDEAWRS